MKNKRYLLATDLDNTFVGDPSSLGNLLGHFEENEVDPAFVYVTGRHLDSALSLIDRERLPSPDLLITDVGTAIYHSPELEEDQGWSDWVNETWKPEELLQFADNFPFLHQQELPHQKRISFTADSASLEDIQQFRQQLEQTAIPHHFVFSSGRDLDLLPERSGKGKAVEYIIRQYAHPEVNILLAGDSGNDAEMLSLDYPAVIVGNAQQELHELPAHSLLYRANGHYAEGIREAWRHFYPIKT